MSQKYPPYFFGYGSLVNRSTHNYGNPTRATAQGWRRLWRHTGKRPVAFLTVVPDPSCCIDGLIASVPGADWAALDAREWAYDRVPASDQVRHDLDHQPSIHLYTVAPDRNHAPDTQHPILLSYIDVVVQGYLTEFGIDGATRFFETTDGWDAPILNDRAKMPVQRALQMCYSNSTIKIKVFKVRNIHHSSPLYKDVSSTNRNSW